MHSATSPTPLVALHTPLFPLFFFFFNDTATTEIYTLSLHDALPILRPGVERAGGYPGAVRPGARALSVLAARAQHEDRKSTRLNSSHVSISYAVFCLKKKKKIRETTIIFSIRSGRYT